jgi:hypothetical protein
LIYDADHREAGLLIGGQMSGAHDASRADDEDGTDLLWVRLPDGLESFENSVVKIFSCGRI